MATIQDLQIPDFSSLSDDELTQLIREVRGRRRNPSKELKQKTREFAQKRAKKGKAVALTNVVSSVKNLSPEQAAELLKKLGASNE